VADAQYLLFVSQGALAFHGQARGEGTVVGMLTLKSQTSLPFGPATAAFRQPLSFAGSGRAWMSPSIKGTPHPPPGLGIRWPNRTCKSRVSQ
jgi:hypothetical protein